MQEIFVNGEYQYDYECVGKVHTLYYSEGEEWCDDVKGQIAMQITDDGNGLIFGKKVRNKKYNYDTALYLTILMKMIHSEYKFEISNKLTF